MDEESSATPGGGHSDLERSQSSHSSAHEDAVFVDADTSSVHAAPSEDGEDGPRTLLKPPLDDMSPRSSNASTSDAAHSGYSIETDLTPLDESATLEDKRLSQASGRTADSVPLDDVPLEIEEKDVLSPLPDASLRSPTVGTPTRAKPQGPTNASPSLVSTGQFDGRRPSWRQSTPLSPVSLSASSLVAATEAQELSSLAGDAGTSQVGQRQTIASIASTSSENHNFDFLLQRINTQNALLDEDPKARRRSMQATDSLRRSFERLHNEMAAEEGLIDWDFWGAVMSDYEKVAREQPRELARAIQKGIPPALRGMMWQLMASSRDAELEAVYQQLLKSPSQHEKAIMRDLARTFPSHEYFKDNEGVGQSNLFNVVKAYSLYDPEVGYCQGLQFIVGPMLLNMPDEEAFCVLVRLMKSYDLRSHYSPDMPGLQLRLFQFDRLLEEHLPSVFMHLLRQGVKSSMYASQWFLTMLSYRFPLELVYSVLDLVFAEGVEAILRFSLALMKKNEAYLLGLDFEQLLDFLKNGMFDVYKTSSSDDNKIKYSAANFVKDALKIKLSPLQLDHIAHEWSSMCQQRDAQGIEMDRLRMVNAQLSAQVRKLEASLAQINEEHCDLVRQVVHARLEREEVEEELVKWKIAVAQAGVEITIPP